MFEFLRGWRKRRKRESATVPEPVWSQVEASLPFLDFLAPPQRARLREMACAFLAEKQFHGANGLPLTDQMLLSIALQACLPVLNLGLEAYRGWVGIVVYAGDFVIPRSEMDESGVVHEFNDTVLGEAWEDGPVLIGWCDPAAADDGINVVIHEFVHKLDMLNGEADGLPPLPAHMSRVEWARVFSAAYETLCAQVDTDQPSALDPYASEDPAEFFAVASESFFEAPAPLHEAFPAVYEQLRRYYGLDPMRVGTPDENESAEGPCVHFDRD